MGTDEVIVRRGLPDRLRPDAAKIYDEAFAAKFRISIPSETRRRAFLAWSLRTDCIVVAMVDGELLGLIGLKAREGRYRGGDLSFAPFREVSRCLGLLGAIWAVATLSFLDHIPKPGELHVDSVAVASSARGRGIGTRLLDEAVDIAREDGFRWLRLEVVDTNPRAQALYERLGYRVTRVQSVPFMRPMAGFSAVVSMELAVTEGTSSADATGSRAP